MPIRTGIVVLHGFQLARALITTSGIGMCAVVVGIALPTYLERQSSKYDQIMLVHFDGISRTTQRGLACPSFTAIA
jgi:hypothetical protein